MTEMTPKDPEKKNKLTTLVYRYLKPIKYIGVGLFILIFGQLTPSIPDEIFAEIILILFYAGSEISDKIKAAKK